MEKSEPRIEQMSRNGDITQTCHNSRLPLRKYYSMPSLWHQNMPIVWCLMKKIQLHHQMASKVWTLMFDNARQQPTLNYIFFSPWTMVWKRSTMLRWYMHFPHTCPSELNQSLFLYQGSLSAIDRQLNKMSNDDDEIEEVLASRWHTARYWWIQTQIAENEEK